MGIGDKGIHHGHYIIFKLAEADAPRTFFGAKPLFFDNEIDGRISLARRVLGHGFKTGGGAKTQ